MRQDPLNDEMLRRLYQPAEVPEGFDTAWRAAVRREEIKQMSEHKPSKQSIFKKIGRVAVPVLCALVLIIGAAGVSDFAKTNYTGGAAPTPAPAYQNSGSAMYTAAAKSSSARSGESDAYAMAEYGAADVVMEMEESAAYGYDYNATEAPAQAAGSSLPVENTMERKLVRTADLTIRTTAYDDDLAAIEALLKDMGGYIEYRYESGDREQGSLRRATLTMRVPSDKLDAFLSGTEGIGRVTERNESAVDMTTQYYDNQTRLDTLYKKMERLQQMMAEATRMSDLIELESAISETQYEIDSYETRQRTIQNQVDMSAVNITLREETVREQTQARKNTLGERIVAALTTGFGSFVDFLQNVLVFLTMMLPVIVVIAVIITVCVIVRKKNKKHREAAETKSNDKNEEA